MEWNKNEYKKKNKIKPNIVVHTMSVYKNRCTAPRILYMCIYIAIDVLKRTSSSYKVIQYNKYKIMQE